eukprot:TCONS_00058588-protein
MEGHIKNLKLICRMCGLKSHQKDYKNPKSVMEYSAIIKQVFKLNVTEENESIFSKVLCKRCHMKLYRLKNKNLDIPPDELTSHGDSFFEFRPHSEECYVCTLASKRGPGIKRPKLFNLKEEIKHLKGYTTLEIENEMHITDIDRLGKAICIKTLIIDVNEKTWKFHALNRYVSSPFLIDDVLLPSTI